MRFCQFSKVFFLNGNQLVWKSVISTIVTKIVLDGKNACASLGAFVFENETKYFVNNYVVFCHNNDLYFHHLKRFVSQNWHNFKTVIIRVVTMRH